MNKDLKFPSASVLAGIKSPQQEKGTVTKNIIDLKSINYEYKTNQTAHCAIK